MYRVGIDLGGTTIAAGIVEDKGRSVALENDANVAALGEYYLQGLDVSSFFMVTLGTGVGGAVRISTSFCKRYAETYAGDQKILKKNACMVSTYS